MIQLGDLVRCKITGFEGIATCKREFLYAATDYIVQPIGLKNDGEIKGSMYIEEGRLELAGTKAAVGFVLIAGDRK